MLNSYYSDDLSERSWLVQRLQRPFGRSAAGPFTFGGGLKNGGLSDGAMALLQGVLEFDYMGAAEFEFGSVPAAFKRLAKYAEAGELTTREIVIPLSEVQPDWLEIPRGARHETRKHWKMDGEKTVYVLARESWHEAVEERIRFWAANRWATETKESLGLASALRPAAGTETKWVAEGREACGWLELDNGFMFFTDKDMFDGVCRIFGVGTEDETGAA